VTEMTRALQCYSAQRCSKIPHMLRWKRKGGIIPGRGEWFNSIKSRCQRNVTHGAATAEDGKGCALYIVAVTTVKKLDWRTAGGNKHRLPERFAIIQARFATSINLKMQAPKKHDGKVPKTTSIVSASSSPSSGISTSLSVVVYG
jgi:hypothetical protein